MAPRVCEVPRQKVRCRRIYEISPDRRINRYYDPGTDQFLSIDPAVAVTGQPYVFTNDNPQNSTDPLGTLATAIMAGGYQSAAQQATELNQLFQEQRQDGQAIGNGVVAGVVKTGGRNVLTVTVIPANIMNPGSFVVVVLADNTKNVEKPPPPVTLSGVCEASFGIAGMGLATAGGDILTGVLTSPETDGTSLVVAAYGVLTFAAGALSFLTGTGKVNGICYD
ncbi:MAG: hypothetical protein ACRDV0_00905 [Acidimicrobiales bacterium]